MAKISIIIASLSIAFNFNISANANEAEAQFLKDSVQSINVSIEQSSSIKEQAALLMLRSVTEAALGQDKLSAFDATMASELDPTLTAQVK